IRSAIVPFRPGAGAEASAPASVRLRLSPAPPGLSLRLWRRRRSPGRVPSYRIHSDLGPVPIPGGPMVSVSTKPERTDTHNAQEPPTVEDPPQLGGRFCACRRGGGGNLRKLH